MASSVAERVAVIGTTGWGTTLAVLLARNGNQTTLVARTEAEVAQLTRDGENQRHRPGLRFPEGLRIAADAATAGEAEIVVLAVPSASLAANLQTYAGTIGSDATVLTAIKGVDPETAQRMSEIIAGAGVDADRILAVSGPNFATEIARGLPAATVVAGRDSARAERVQQALNGPAFRVYTSDDVAGVEFGGALKNVIAIACGISDGLGLGQNAKAALMTRGLAEITRLGTACGAKAMTFLGLSGIGDLIATCESDLSRNRRLGLALAGGKGVVEALAGIDGVVEGAVTARAVRRLQERAGVEMPISSELEAVLYEGKDPKASMIDLMTRAPRTE